MRKTSSCNRPDSTPFPLRPHSQQAATYTAFDLARACSRGNALMVRRALEDREVVARGGGKPLDLEARDKGGLTPLLSAVRKGHQEVVALLLEAGASSLVTDLVSGLCRVAWRGVAGIGDCGPPMWDAEPVQVCVGSVPQPVPASQSC